MKLGPIDLETINEWLRRLRLVLVVEIDHPDGESERKPTRLWVEPFSSYLARTYPSTEANS